MDCLLLHEIRLKFACRKADGSDSKLIYVYQAGEGQLKELESELIDKIDVLAERGCGDAEWRVRFVSLCGALCGAADGPLRAGAFALVAAAARQLDTLLQVPIHTSINRTNICSVRDSNPQPRRRRL